MLKGAVGCDDMALKINQVGTPISETLHSGQAEMSFALEMGAFYRNTVEKHRSLSQTSLLEEHPRDKQQKPPGQEGVGGRTGPSAGDEGSLATRKAV